MNETASASSSLVTEHRRRRKREKRSARVALHGRSAAAVNRVTISEALRTVCRTRQPIYREMKTAALIFRIREYSVNFLNNHSVCDRLTCKHVRKLVYAQCNFNLEGATIDSNASVSSESD